MRICSISHVNQWLQTICSFPIRFLQYVVCKSMVAISMFVPNTISAEFQSKSVITNPMFVHNVILAAFHMQSRGYKPYVCSQCDFCCISYAKQLLQIPCSFKMRLLQYFECKSVVINPMFVPYTISAAFRK